MSSLGSWVCTMARRGGIVKKHEEEQGQLNLLWILTCTKFASRLGRLHCMRWGRGVCVVARR